MSAARREGTLFRGQPLLLIAATLSGWVVLRIAMWQPGGDGPPLAALPPELEVPLSAAVDTLARVTMFPESEAGDAARPIDRRTEAPVIRLTLPPVTPYVRPDLPDTIRFVPSEARLPAPSPAEAESPPASARMVVGHSLLLAAGLSQMEVPVALLAYIQRAAGKQRGVPSATPPALAKATAGAPQSDRRWSVDSWLLLRDGGSDRLLSSAPTYGRSQLGAVLRYRLDPASGHRPEAYLRGSAALAGVNEREIAAGLSARPVPGVPLRVAAELRGSDTGTDSELRPAAFAVSELPPLELSPGLRAEAYLQAGYVGGRYATAFADGQARIDGELARDDDLRLTAGAGAWGGAQKGSARLDIGPSAGLSFRLGETRGRVSADYRFRVAGNAEPASGPAVTLSAGF